MKKINLFSPKFDRKEVQAAIKSLKSSIWASGAGTGKVSEFERNFKKFIGCDECVALNSGTAALHLALNILDIKDKEVLVPSITFVSTVHSILYNGGIPVFVDVQADTLCLDPVDLRNKITKRTKAVVPVHFGGFPCDINNIMKTAMDNEIHVIDDAAHACGTKYRGMRIGAINELSCFSFHPVKNLAMPKGGAITINSKNHLRIKQKLNSLRWCGIDKRKGPFYDVTNLGFNYYMDEISAAIGIEQLKKVENFNNIRFSIARRYNSKLDVTEKMPLNSHCSYHLYWIRVKNRKKFMKNMAMKGVETGSHYSPVHLMSYYNNTPRHLTITEKAASEIVTLPMHPNLREDDVEFVITTVNSLI